MPVIVMPMKNARGKSRCGFVRLLDHVHGVLETDDREERERRAADDERERIAAGVELERARPLADSVAERAKRRSTITIKKPS